MPELDQHASEVAGGQRFEFGANWARFLSLLDESRIVAAEDALRKALGVTTLDGLTMVDAGSGSGLMSLAARRLGAKVVSFDFDPASVACTTELRRRYFPDHDGWTVHEGSILDPAFVAGLGQFDLVYSWGVLHHTGQMWPAIDSASRMVTPGGRFFLAIYNHQVYLSAFSLRLKRAYVRAPDPLKWLVLAPFAAFQVAKGLLKDLLFLRNPVARYRQQVRGMSWWYDLVDWVGGYPFEVAKPEEIFDFLRQRGFALEYLQTCGGGHGCNEFVVRRLPLQEPAAPVISGVG